MKKLTAFQIIAIGQISLFGGILLLFFGHETVILSLLAGLLFGLSMVMNIRFLILVQKKYKKDKEIFNKYRDRIN